MKMYVHWTCINWTIGKYKYNAFCYADDVLLTSTTVSGLQSLMDTANEYITQHGLRFSPLKTNCLIQGKIHLIKYHLGFSKIIKYLLTIFVLGQQLIRKLNNKAVIFVIYGH